MSFYPYSWLFHSQSTTIAISGPIIQLLDTNTGDVLHVITNSTGPVRCAARSPSGDYLLTVADDKILKLWKLHGLELVNQRELPKRPTAIQFTADGQNILVSDKFGDVFSYPFHYTPPAEKHQKDKLSSHENPSDGQLLLGHVSLLTTFLLTKDERYIITADRDEHIRVSWYPQCYNIEMYCLGHTKFVSAIHVPAFEPSQLISGGGDPVLKIWDWITGKVKHEFGILEVVEPYIQVRAPANRGKNDEDALEAKRKGRGKKAKGKGKTRDATLAQDTNQQERADPVGPADVLTEAEKTEKVLVVGKIDTTPSHHIIFSAVGATALFVVPYPVDNVVLDIKAFDFEQPVLNFFVAEDGLIWVTLDANRTPESSERTFVRVIDLSSGKPEIVETDRDSSLLAALDSQLLYPASVDELRQLDLYSSLISMPKGKHEVEDHEPTSAEAEAEKQLSKKTRGRLKNKQAVQEKAQALLSTSAKTAREDDEPENEEPDSKKIKPEGDVNSQQDASMDEP